MLEVSGRICRSILRTKVGGEFTNKLVKAGDVELTGDEKSGRIRGLKRESKNDF